MTKKQQEIIDDENKLFSVIPKNKKQMMAAAIMEEFLNYQFDKLIATPGFREKFTRYCLGEPMSEKDFQEFIDKA